MEIEVVNNSMIKANAPNDYLPAGTFKIRAHKANRGYSIANPDTITVSFQSQPFLASSIKSSFVGGK